MEFKVYMPFEFTNNIKINCKNKKKGKKMIFNLNLEKYKRFKSDFIKINYFDLVIFKGIQ